MASRSDDIRAKLAYAQLRLNVLRQELNSVQATEGKVAFVGQKVEEILSACRECFDYASKDLSEMYLKKVPKTSYFPLSLKNLESGAFKELRETHPSIYQHLSELVNKIDENAVIENTFFRLGIARDVNHLVNDKKHNRITIAKKRQNAATHVQFPGGAKITMSPIYRFEGDVPEFGDEVDAEPMIGNYPNIEIAYISEYRLAENNWEISRYCNHAIEVTWRLLQELYQATSMGVDLVTFSPHESLKPAEQIAFEAFLKKAEHIVTQLKAVAFYQGDKRSCLFGLNLEGNGKYKNQDEEYLANLLEEVFRVFVLPQHVRPGFGRHLRENMSEFERSEFEEKHWDITSENKQKATLKLTSGAEIQFDKTVWGFRTRFRQAMPESSGLQIVTPEIMARVALLFPDLQHQVVIGTRPLNR